MLIFTEIPPPPFSRWHLFGPFYLTCYAIAILTGVVIAAFITQRRYRYRGGDPERIWDVLLWGLPLGIVGARIYHVLTVPWDYFGPTGNLWEIPQVWRGGIAIFGGLIASSITAWLVLRHYRQRLGPFADAVAPAFPLAQGIGRLGNYFNQELFGAPTTLPWGLRVEPEHIPPQYPTDTLFHPTFLYEMLWNFSLAALLFFLDRKLRGKLKSFQLFWLYLMGYAVGRFWVESLRLDHAQVFYGLRLNAWTAVLVFCLAVVAFFVAGRIGKSSFLHSDEIRPAGVESGDGKAVGEAELASDDFVVGLSGDDNPVDSGGVDDLEVDAAEKK